MLCKTKEHTAFEATPPHREAASKWSTTGRSCCEGRACKLKQPMMWVCLEMGHTHIALKPIKLPFRKNDEAWVFVYHLYPRFRQTYVFVQLWRAVGGSSRRLPARRSSPLRSVITVTKPRALRWISMLSCGRTPAMAAWFVKYLHLAWPCMTHMLQLKISRCTLTDTDVNHGLKDWRHGLSVKVHVAEGNSIDKRRCAWYACWRGRRFLRVIPGIPIFFELGCVGWASACSDATVPVVMSTI